MTFFTAANAFEGKGVDYLEAIILKLKKSGVDGSALSLANNILSTGSRICYTNALELFDKPKL